MLADTGAGIRAAGGSRDRGRKVGAECAAMLALAAGTGVGGEGTGRTDDAAGTGSRDKGRNVEAGMGSRLRGRNTAVVSGPALVPGVAMVPVTGDRGGASSAHVNGDSAVLLAVTTRAITLGVLSDRLTAAARLGAGAVAAGGCCAATAPEAALASDGDGGATKTLGATARGRSEEAAPVGVGGAGGAAVRTCCTGGRACPAVAEPMVAADVCTGKAAFNVLRGADAEGLTAGVTTGAAAGTAVAATTGTVATGATTGTATAASGFQLRCGTMAGDTSGFQLLVNATVGDTARRSTASGFQLRCGATAGETSTEMDADDGDRGRPGATSSVGAIAGVEGAAAGVSVPLAEGVAVAGEGTRTLPPPPIGGGCTMGGGATTGVAGVGAVVATSAIMLPSWGCTTLAGDEDAPGTTLGEVFVAGAPRTQGCSASKRPAGTRLLGSLCNKQ